MLTLCIKYFSRFSNKNVRFNLRKNSIIPAYDNNKVIPLCCCSQMYFYGYCKCNK